MEQKNTIRRTISPQEASSVFTRQGWQITLGLAAWHKDKSFVLKTVSTLDTRCNRGGGINTFSQCVDGTQWCFNDSDSLTHYIMIFHDCITFSLST